MPISARFVVRSTAALLATGLLMLLLIVGGTIWIGERAQVSFGQLIEARDPSGSRTRSSTPTLTSALAEGTLRPGRAVTLGVWAAGSCANKQVVSYIIAQLVGALLGAAMLCAIASGKPEWVPGGFAANGYGELSSGK